MSESLKKIPAEKLEALEETMAAFGQAAPPDWFDGSSVDEIAFSEYVLYKHPMRCIHDRLYDIDGLLSDAAVQSEILEYVRPYVKSNVAKNVEKYLNALKLAAYCPELPIQEDRIHFQNGTYFIEDRRFTPEKEFCLNRLPVRYDSEAPVPERWLKFLGELLYPEDIPTLQEFMGYTLLPSNKGQKMMIIIGNGGEGKSRIGRVLRAILGDNMNTTAIDKLSKDKFCRADQEGKLLMLDDDMKLQALDDTNILKAIITMTGIRTRPGGKPSVQTAGTTGKDAMGGIYGKDYQYAGSTAEGFRACRGKEAEGAVHREP